MNGRVYDPVLGRFLSADPNVDGVGDAQGYNRYSYVSNNPMNATDPSGYFSLKDAVKIVAIVVVAYFTAGAALYLSGGITGVAAGATATFGNALAALAGTGGFGVTFGGAIAAGAGAGFASGFAGSLLNGGSIGDAFKAGMIGGVIGGVTGGLTYGIGNMAKLGYWGKAAAHGVVSGAAEEARGGQFRHGFYAGFATGGLSKLIGMAPQQVRFIAAAIVGGTAAALGGGKFANGAVSGAFQYLLNDSQPAHQTGKHVIVVDRDDEGNPFGTNATGEDFAGAADQTEFKNPRDTVVINARLDIEEQLKGAGIGKSGIDRLSFVDHSSGFPIVKPFVQEMGTVDLSRDLLMKFSPYLSPQATICFYGCWVGTNTDYLKMASEALGGRTVWGPTDKYFYTYRNINLRRVYEPLKVPNKENGFVKWPE